MDCTQRIRPQVIAHRGFSGQFPENTLIAIEAAIALAVDMVEVDIRLSRDGVPVLCHNAEVDRTSDGCGAVAALSLAELKQLDVGAWKGAAFYGQRMPTLDEALRVAAGRTSLNLDVKDPAALPAVVRALEEHAMRQHVVISGCTWRTVGLVRRHMHGVPVLLNVDWTVGLLVVYGWRRIALQLLLWQSRLCRAVGINVIHRYVTADAVARFRRANQPVWTWTVNTEKRARTLAAMGVASITSNHPDRILAALN